LLPLPAPAEQTQRAEAGDVVTNVRFTPKSGHVQRN